MPSESSSSSSNFAIRSGNTYLCEFQDVNSINNNVISNDVVMQYMGNFIQSWNPFTLSLTGKGYGVKRDLGTKGAIFCSDASKLFSMSKGYLSFVISFPYNIINGVYSNILDKEYFLFGVNAGNYDVTSPGFSAKLTSSGIEYKFLSSASNITFIDDIITINANNDMFIEFFWDANHRFSEFDFANVVVRVNGVGVVGANIPIANNSLSNVNFWMLDTPLLGSDLECTIKYLSIHNEIPINLEWELYSSSSSSSDISSFSSQSHSNSSSSSSSTYSSSSSTLLSFLNTSSSTSSKSISSSSSKSRSSTSSDSSLSTLSSISIDSSSTESSIIFSHSSLSSSTSSESPTVACNGCSPALKECYQVTFANPVTHFSCSGIQYTFSGSYRITYTSGCWWQWNGVGTQPYVGLYWNSSYWSLYIGADATVDSHANWSLYSNSCTPIGSYSIYAGCFTSCGGCNVSTNNPGITIISC